MNQNKKYWAVFFTAGSFVLPTLAKTEAKAIEKFLDGVKPPWEDYNGVYSTKEFSLGSLPEWSREDLRRYVKENPQDFQDTDIIEVFNLEQLREADPYVVKGSLKSRKKSLTSSKKIARSRKKIAHVEAEISRIDQSDSVQIGQKPRRSGHYGKRNDLSRQANLD